MSLIGVAAAPRFVADVAAVGTVAGLLVQGVLASGATSPKAFGVARAAAAWAALWCLATAATLAQVLAGGDDGGPGGAAVRQLLLTGVLVAAVAVLARGADTSSQARRALFVALVALTPVMARPQEGHGGTGLRPMLAFHVVAATLWAGTIVGLLLHLRDDRTELVRAAALGSRLALVCFTVVALTGPLSALPHLAGPADLWGTSYGRLVVVKLLAILALGGFGMAHRRRSLRQLAAGRPAAFVRLATVELAVMLATMAVAVALSRAAARGTAGAVRPHVADVGPAPLSPARLVLEWQWAPLLTVVTVGAALLYLVGVVRVTGNGRSWPRRCTAAAVGGAAVALYALVGGVAVYAPTQLSAHVGQYLALTLVVPALVVTAAPLALARCGTGRPLVVPGSRRTDPVHTCCGLMGVTALVYATPLLELSTRSPAGHLAVLVVAAATGLCFWWSLLGQDPSKVALPAHDRSAVLVALLVFLTVFGALLGFRRSDPAASWVVWGFVLAIATAASARNRAGSGSRDAELPPVGAPRGAVLLDE